MVGFSNNIRSFPLREKLEALNPFWMCLALFRSKSPTYRVQGLVLLFDICYSVFDKIAICFLCYVSSPLEPSCHRFNHEDQITCFQELVELNEPVPQ